MGVNDVSKLEAYRINFSICVDAHNAQNDTPVSSVCKKAERGNH